MSVSDNKSPQRSRQIIYLLDANIISYFIRGEYKGLNHTMLTALSQQQCAASVMTYAELQFGNALKPLATQSKKRTNQTLAQLTILPWTIKVADVYAVLKARLRQQGRPIGELDTQIAAHALAEDLTLITHNIKHFDGIDGLKLEDWTL